MNRNEIIMKAIKEKNISSSIEKMMREDIQKAELHMATGKTVVIKDLKNGKSFIVGSGMLERCNVTIIE